MQKITSVETFVVGVPPPYWGGTNWVFVKLGTSDGVVGWGECNVPIYREKSTVSIVKEMAEHFVLNKQNPFNIEQLWIDLYSGDQTPVTKSFTNLRPPGALTMQAVAALEMACWDIVGKTLGQPVYNLLGGKCREELRTYSYILDWSPGSPAEAIGDKAQEMVDKGITALKLDPIPPFFPQARQIELEELRYTERVLAAFRDRVGDKADILVGTHGQLATHAAIRYAKVIEQFDPMWFEEPVPPENMDEMAIVQRSTSVPVATGERLSGKWDFHRVLESGAARILQPNVGLNGILETKKIAVLAETRYAHVAPWLHCGPVATAAALHASISMPNFLILEGLDDWGGFFADVMQQPFDWHKGYVRASTTPGLGADLRENMLHKHPMNDYAQFRRSGGTDRYQASLSAKHAQDVLARTKGR